ncbi:MAG: endonuclease III [Sediminibacterium sp.]
MKLADRYVKVLSWLDEQFPIAETELSYGNPYELLVAVILSAQCTDKRVNMVTPAIFKKYPTPEKLAAGTFDDVFALIKSISYPNNKSKHLIGMAQLLMEKFNGEVPLTVEELVQLPGVGRKTANVITSVIDQQPNMAVDTHVFRVSKRIGLVNSKATTPLAVEKQLIRHIPRHLVHKAHHWLILHGRYLCMARNPNCAACGLQDTCKFYQTVAQKAAAKKTASPKTTPRRIATKKATVQEATVKRGSTKK